MSYNPNEIDIMQPLPAGIMKTGVIKNIKDGTVKDFITDKGKESWQGDVSQPAIQLEVELMYEEKTYNANSLFTYFDIDGKTQFSERSNLGKYHKYYKKAPEVGDQVQCKTNADGFFKLVVE